MADLTPANVIVITSDEHNPAFMGCTGGTPAITPNLDRLAANGLRFTDVSTPSPICVPARAAMATGLPIHAIGHWDNAMPYRGKPLSSWGHALQDAGVRVESIGKLHYRDVADDTGFDAQHLPMHVAGGHGMVWASIRDPYVTRQERERGKMLGNNVGPGESAYTEYDRKVTERTLAWLTEASKEQAEGWVLNVGLVAPHFPLTVPQEFFDLYQDIDLPAPKLHPRDGHVLHPWVAEHAAFADTEADFADETDRRRAVQAYLGLCSWLDHNVGLILDKLSETGLDRTTRVIYLSDHGDNVGARGLWGKSNMYQESVTVPFMMAGPGIEPGICRTPCDLLDLFPTILNAAGVPMVSDTRPGRSLFDVAAGTAVQRAAFSEYHAAGSNSAAFMVRSGPWKLIHYVGHAPELFDLSQDPNEAVNRAGDPDCREKLAEMHAILRDICDPEAVDLQAKADQAALVERFGGRAIAAGMGASGATPPPGK